jgi:hypothetical protein
MGTTNPHDAFAKTVMGKIENARDFFHGVLPECLRALLDLKTLRLEKESYIDSELSEFFMDIVYACTYRGSPVKLVLLFEHKSFVPDYPHFQLLQHLIPILSSGMLYFRGEEGLRFLRTVLLYIEKGSGLNKNDIQQAMEKADPLIREEYMTLYEQHIQEGMKRGYSGKRAG